VSENLQSGDRIRLVSMACDPDPILVGQAGIVRRVSYHGHGTAAWQQVEVDWDNGRQLMLAVPPDTYEIISRAESKGD